MEYARYMREDGLLKLKCHLVNVFIMITAIILKEMICPIYLTFEELSRSQINKNVLIQIEGKGSCLDGYKVYISESGLKYVQ